ncbi:hypothetical protein OROMI_016476 [Orobanche minor]
MAATVARESELHPPVKKLQADLAESKKKYGELCERMEKMEKDSIDAAERARLHIEHLVGTNALLKEQAAADITLHRDEMDRALADIKRLSEKAEASKTVEARAAKLAEELAAKTSALDREREKSAARETELERLRAALASKEFAYYMAFADALRSAKKGGLDIGPLLETFREYATNRPRHPGFLIPILDLSTEHGIDLSWYSRFDRLIQPVVPGEGSDEGVEEGEDRAR